MNISEEDPILRYNFKGTYRDVGTLLFLCPKGYSSESATRF